MTRVLLDDCFLHDKDRLTHDEALTILKARARPVVGVEAVNVYEAAGRILAETVIAPRPIPAHDNAAVDGYAFAHADYEQARDGLPVEARIAAGHTLSRALQPGAAARIFTGAVMPEGADTVAMQEDVEVRDGRAFMPPGLKRGANRRLAGEDVKAGETLSAPGLRLRPQDVAAIASAGFPSVKCYERMRAAYVSTGDELLQPGEPFAPGTVYDSNAAMLAGLCAASGAAFANLGALRDDVGEVRSALTRAAERHHVLITTGGASRGEEDHIVKTIAEIGSLHMWQLAIKPGRPMAFGQIGDCVVLGLPGNPVAAFVCFLLYARPLLAALGGCVWPEPRRFPLPAAFTVEKRKAGRREFWRGATRLEGGVLSVEKFDRDGSGLISGLRAGDGLIEIPEEHGGVKQGELVPFIPFSEFGIQS
jgi:molybdopterin molybdotransferase